MVRTVAIIGSFQKYYDEILKVIQIFKSAGICVVSPKESFISGRVEDFVIFDSDKKSLSPAEIQMITLEKIISADAVYVYNPGGYVGRTTCYEIGFCISKKKALFYLELPSDLPIPVSEEKQVMKPDAFVQYSLSNDISFVTKYNLCAEGEQAFMNLIGLEKEIKNVKAKKIVICGSMAFYDEMLKCQKQLEKIGIEAVIPKEEDDSVKLYSEKQFSEFKKKVSRAYLKKIRDKDTAGVLIYNADKRGIKNYIGANTLVEIAMAFVWNRKIFLLNDIYQPLRDELEAWNCICLEGNVFRLKDLFLSKNTQNEEPEATQLSIFDD